MALDLSPSGTGRMVVAFVVLGVLALSARFTMEAGKYRTLTLLLLAFFGVRVVLGWARSRKMEKL